MTIETFYTINESPDQSPSSRVYHAREYIEGLRLGDSFFQLFRASFCLLESISCQDVPRIKPVFQLSLQPMASDIDELLASNRLSVTKEHSVTDGCLAIDGYSAATRSGVF